MKALAFYIKRPSSLFGHGSATWCDSINVIITGVKSAHPGPAWVLWPNPAHESLNVRAKGLQFGKCQLRVLDAMGKEVLSSTYTLNSGVLKEQIDIKNLALGMYFVELENGSKRLFQKLIIQ